MKKTILLIVATTLALGCNAFAPRAPPRTNVAARHVVSSPFDTLPFTKELNLSFLDKTPSPSKDKILVLGTGFVGSQIVSQLDKLNINHITASKSGNADYQIDLSSVDAIDQIAKIAQGCTAVISTVGSIGDKNDEMINAASGNAAIGAKKAGVKRFVFIGNEERIRDVTKTVMPNYAAGKEQAESVIRQEFPDSHTIIQPNFIYGGEEFGMNPPRVPDKIGEIAEDILGLYPLQAASEALPGIFGIALGAPVSRERVAAAAINAALGLCDSCLNGREDIILAASKRPKPQTRSKQSVQSLKQQIYDLGDCEAQEPCLAEAFSLMEEIETLNTKRPATDPLLNGRWDFVFDVEADQGTSVVKEILNGNSPIKPIFNMEDLYLNITDNNSINIMVMTKVIGIPIELILKTSITPDENDPTGTVFFERFEGADLMGIRVPIPEKWQRARPLEFSYMDENMLIARGNGGEPHYLKRD